MRTTGLMLAGVTLAFSGADRAVAAPLGTPASIRAEIVHDGARAVVDRLWAHGRWDAVEDRIASGDRAWVGLAPALATGTDAGASEGLGIALADALPKAPDAVVAVLDLKDGPVLGPSRVCAMPFLEPSAAFLRRYRARAAAAVAGVRSPALAKARAACLAALRASAAAGRADVR